MMNWRDHITVDPNVCHGKPCIRGTRVMVSVVLDNLAAGEPPEAIARDYHVSVDDVSATLHFAAELAKARTVPIPAGT